MEQGPTIQLEQLKAGMVLVYRLPSSQAPKDPMREWKGKIKDVWVATRYGVGAVKVEVLEPGYEGDAEIIYPEQIVRIEAETE
jgi:hypothetical protein